MTWPNKTIILKRIRYTDLIPLCDIGKIRCCQLYFEWWISYTLCRGYTIFPDIGNLLYWIPVRWLCRFIYPLYGKPITQAGFNYHNLLKELRQGDSLIINGQPELFARMKFHIGEISRLNSNTLQEYFMEDMISHHFSIILFELSNYIKKDGYSRNLLSRDEEITTKFFTLVKEKYRFEHSVQFYAEQLFITRKYLSKVIKNNGQNA